MTAITTEAKSHSIADLISMSEAADIIGTHRTWVWQLIRQGKLPIAGRLGKRNMYLLDRADVARYAAEHKRASG